MTQLSSVESAVAARVKNNNKTEKHKNLNIISCNNLLRTSEATGRAREIANKFIEDWREQNVHKEFSTFYLIALNDFNTSCYSRENLRTFLIIHHREQASSQRIRSRQHETNAVEKQNNQLIICCHDPNEGIVVCEQIFDLSISASKHEFSLWFEWMDSLNVWNRMKWLFVLLGIFMLKY